jgi:Tol biopolymer transport system component
LIVVAPPAARQLAEAVSGWVSLLAFGLLALLALSAAGASGGTGNGRIVFGMETCYSSTHCHSVVATINPDGSGLRVLTPRNGHVGTPRWSPDRREIAYVRTGLKVPEVWLMSADGTHKRALTRLPQGVWSGGLPSLDWAPNGRQIVFPALRSASNCCDAQLYVVNVGTGATRPLLRSSLTGAAGGADDPVWSPNGRWIALVRSGRDAPEQIWLLSTATGRVRQLTRDKVNSAEEPAWSPNSRQIAFHADYNNHNGIWLLNANGSDLRFVKAQAGSPSWSPNGKWIVVAWNENGSVLAEVRPNGTGYHVIKHFPPRSGGGEPDW